MGFAEVLNPSYALSGHSVRMGGAEAILSNCFQICPDGLFCESHVYPPSQKYSASLFTQITCVSLPSRPTRGAARDRHGRGTGCGGRGRCQKTNDIACGRRSRVVLTPRRWRQVGDDASASRRRWWQTSPVTRESPEETVKTIAQGNAGCPGEPVVTPCAFYLCTRTAGAAGTRHSLRPLLRVACALS